MMSGRNKGEALPEGAHTEFEKPVRYGDYLDLSSILKRAKPSPMTMTKRSRIC